VTDPIDVVRRQVDAFNSHDLSAFLGTYAADAVVVGAGDSPLLGRDELTSFYASRLTDTSLASTLQTILLLGERWVIAHESVASTNAVTEVIAVFEVRDGLIRRATLTKA
jgi:uncharacterized protein (TIGR02246 family)